MVFNFLKQIFKNNIYTQINMHCFLSFWGDRFFIVAIILTDLFAYYIINTKK